MKNKAYIVWAYAVLLLIGGIIGFTVAGSVASLIASGTFAILLSVTAYGIFRKRLYAYDITLGLLACLLGFFSYRFYLTLKPMPAGIMIFMTAAVLIYLASKRKQQIQLAGEQR